MADGLTVLIARGSVGPVRSLWIPSWLLRLAAAASALLLVAAVAVSWLAVDRYKAAAWLAELNRTRQQQYDDLETAFVQQQLGFEELASRAARLQARLSELETAQAEIAGMLRGGAAAPAAPEAAGAPNRTAAAAVGPSPNRTATIALGETSNGQGGPSGDLLALEWADNTLQGIDLALATYAGNLEELRVSALEMVRRQSHTPSIWPVEGWLSSGFGRRKHPITGRQETHEGIDIAAPYGAQIRAPAAGRVSFAGTKPGYGRTVIIDHDYGITTLYGHLSKASVKAGDAVVRGQVIGLVGNSGLSTGPHLHYEVRVGGRPVNPTQFLP